ncbi:MAG TPA: BlaI/MecI/CopY family transcriptional regulator [Gemmatimonadales bacterium]|jgi:predicted transcriptional regulator|nr:BlaI/MecI/CopY family transcriptional regulator [Gemmatimonadales bacterium]
MGVVLTGRELEIMTILWRLGSGTVADVQERLPADLAYTTVLSLIRTMEEKGYLRHETTGRAHRYFPTIQEQAVRRSALKQLVDTVFDGAPEAVLTQLVSDRRLTEADLLRLRRLLDERLPKEDA